MRNARVGETQAGIKMAGRNINNLRYVAEKAMATHSGTLAWKIPWTKEPGRLQSMGSQKSRTWLSNWTELNLLSAIRVVSSAYLRLLIILLAILISACVSSSHGFLMMYSAYKLNKQDDNIQPWRTPFPIWNQSVVPCPVLTVASWSAYRFLRTGQMVWYSHLFQNFP